MKDTHENWKTEIIENLNSKIQYYSDQDKENIKYSFLFKCINSIGTKIDGYRNVKDLKSRIEIIVHSLPIKAETDKKLNYKNIDFLTKIEKLKSFVKTEYNLEDEKSISTNAYIYSFSAGVAIGPLFGVLFLDNIALGICFGIPMGMLFKPVIEKYLIKQAIKKGTLL